MQNLDDAVRLTEPGVDRILLFRMAPDSWTRRHPVPHHAHVVSELGDDHPRSGVDTGIMSGDVVESSVALGARLALVGRDHLYGLMAVGKPGVDPAIDVVRAETT